MKKLELLLLNLYFYANLKFFELNGIIYCPL